MYRFQTGPQQLTMNYKMSHHRLRMHQSYRMIQIYMPLFIETFPYLEGKLMHFL